MITYNVITELLLAQLEQYGFCHVDGVPVSTNDAACQAIIDAYTLADYKAERKAESVAHAKALRDKAVSGYSAGEMASWPIKRAEAMSYVQGVSELDPAACPFLKAEAGFRGITLEAIVARVAANSAAMAGLEAAIGGIDGAHRDAIDALTTWQDVRDYDITSGYPAI